MPLLNIRKHAADLAAARAAAAPAAVPVAPAAAPAARVAPPAPAVRVAPPAAHVVPAARRQANAAQAARLAAEYADRAVARPAPVDDLADDLQEVADYLTRLAEDPSLRQRAEQEAMDRALAQQLDEELNAAPERPAPAAPAAPAPAAPERPVPAPMLDPITGTIMVDPVLLPDGQSVSRVNAPSGAHVIPNRALADVIELFKNQLPDDLLPDDLLPDAAMPQQAPEPLCDMFLQNVMENPVTTPYGYTYEYASIMQHLNNDQDFDPNNRQPLRADQLIPNLAIKELCRLWMQNEQQPTPAAGLRARP